MAGTARVEKYEVSCLWCGFKPQQDQMRKALGPSTRLIKALRRSRRQDDGATRAVNSFGGTEAEAVRFPPSQDATQNFYAVDYHMPVQHRALGRASSTAILIGCYINGSGAWLASQANSEAYATTSFVQPATRHIKCDPERQSKYPWMAIEPFRTTIIILLYPVAPHRSAAPRVQVIEFR
jgi:hypothetical protein